MTVPAGRFPMLLLLDSQNQVQGFLKVRSYDATSVTVAGQLLDHTWLDHPASASPSAAAAPAPQFPHAIIVAPATFNLAPITNPVTPLHLNTGFLPSRDGLKSRTMPTALYNDISPGQVLSAFDLWFTGRGATALFGRYQRAPGVEESDPAGIMLSAALSYDGQVAEFVGFAADFADFSRNNLDYDLRLALANLMFMTAKNVPSMMTLGSSSGGKQLTVLAYGYTWSTNRKIINIYDPAFPGDDSRFLDFSNGEMSQYQSGNDLYEMASIPAQAMSWVDVTIGTLQLQSSLIYPYEDRFPAIKTQSWDSIKVMPTRDGPDSIFAVDDTDAPLRQLHLGLRPLAYHSMAARVRPELAGHSLGRRDPAVRGSLLRRFSHLRPPGRPLLVPGPAGHRLSNLDEQWLDLGRLAGVRGGEILGQGPPGTRTPEHAGHLDGGLGRRPAAAGGIGVHLGLSGDGTPLVESPCRR